MLKKNIWLILIVMIACVLRFVKLDYLELFGDEVDAGYQAYSLMTTGKDYKGHFLPLYAQSFSEWRAPMMMYFMVPFIKIFGLNEIGVRFMPAMMGVVSILGLYYLLQKIGVNKRVSLLSILLVAIMPWHIQYSRAAFEITLMSGLIIWGLYFLVEVLDKNKFVFAVLSALFLCLSFYTYNTSNIYVPLLSLFIILLYKKINKNLIIFIVMSFIFCLPILWQIAFGNAAQRFGKVSIFGDKNTVAEIIDYRNKSNNSFVSKVFFNKPVYFAKKITSNYLNAFSADFLFGNGDVTFRHSLHKVGNIFWVGGVFSLIGLLILLTSKKQSLASKFIIGFLLISPIPASLTSDGYFHATRLFIMIFPLAALGGYGIDFVMSKSRITTTLFVLVLLFEFANYQNYYWNFYKNESWRWWHSGYKELISKVDLHKTEYNKIYIENTYEPSLIRYLFWNKEYPMFNIVDSMVENGADNLNGFCINSKVCFVNYKGIVNESMLTTNNLYIVSQSVNAGVDNWNINTPSNIKIVETIKNPIGENIFYLVAKKAN